MRLELWPLTGLNSSNVFIEKTAPSGFPKVGGTKGVTPWLHFLKTVYLVYCSLSNSSIPVWHQPSLTESIWESTCQIWSNGLVVSVHDSEYSCPVKKQWIAPSSTEHFIPSRQIKRIPGNFGDLMVKNKLSCNSGSAALRQLHPIHKMRSLTFFHNLRKINRNYTRTPSPMSFWALLISSDRHSKLPLFLFFNFKHQFASL